MVSTGSGLLWTCSVLWQPILAEVVPTNMPLAFLLNKKNSHLLIVWQL